MQYILTVVSNGVETVNDAGNDEGTALRWFNDLPDEDLTAPGDYVTLVRTEDDGSNAVVIQNDYYVV